MSELCASKVHFSSLVISDLILFCSFILSHPLYFSYFIFFSPYLVKLVSFLSPLFITTFLLLLAFLNESFPYELAQNRASHLHTSRLERFRSKKDDQNEEIRCFEDLGIYDILFGPSTVTEIEANPVEIFDQNSEEDPLKASQPVLFAGSDKEDLSIGSNKEDFVVNKVEINPVPDAKLENPCEERRLENFLKILGEFERMANSGVEGRKTVEPTTGAKADKVVEKPKAVSLLRNGSKAKGDNRIINVATKVAGKDCNSMVKTQSQRINSNVVDHGDEDDDVGENNLKVESSRKFDHDNSNFGSYGSMRKEKEWKRTLACKLFEERHNVDGGEGMDSLWEAYEMDSNKTTNQKKKKKNEDYKKEKRKNKKSEVELYDEEEEEIGGQLCCLQALNLSARKMNLGMGRPNLIKISKAIRGIGWLHHVTKSSKKVHNNGDRLY